jgi:putative ABC transport system permease protein
MTAFRRAVSILAGIFRRDRAEARLDDELREYVAMSAAEKIRDGVLPDDAQRLARLELGGLEQAKERVRGERHGHLLDEVARDARYALRMFARTPAFTAVVLLTLALGIGANTAIFSLLDALMLRSLPVRNPSELVLVNLRGRASLDSGGESLSWAIVRALDERRDLFAGVGGFTGSDLDVGVPGAKTRIPCAIVTGGFFETLGLRPQAGRLLTRNDDEPGAPIAAVISDGYWGRAFARSPAAIGQTLVVNGVPATIVGVNPRGFDGANVGQLAEITIAVAAVPRIWPSVAEMVKPGNFWLQALARPARGLSARDAAARLNAGWPALADSVIAPYWPAPRRKAMAELLFVFEPGATGWTYLRETYEKPLLVLMLVSAVVLLIACTNIASLFLARASTRRREIAVRLAIGAGRRRIVRQLLLEGLVMSSAGAALGVGVAWVAGRLLVSLIASGRQDVVLDLAPNWHVLAFSAALATGTGIVFGLAPAFSTRRTESMLALKDDNRTSTTPSKALPFLVALQVALSLVLVTGAGLFVLTLRNLQRVDLGFNPKDVLIVPLERGQIQLVGHALDVVRAVPGVLAAARATHTPLSGSSWSEAIVPVGQPAPEKDNTRVIAVGPQFFETMQIPLLAGREFAEGDGAGALAVAIINQRYADHYFPQQNPIGRVLTGTLASPKPQVEVIGVAENTAASSLHRQPPPIVYVSGAQFGQDQEEPNLVLRVSAAFPGVAEAVRAALEPLSPNRAIEVRLLSDQVNSTIVPERLMATLAGGFGALALLLSSVGLYGLLAYSVAQRRREIGIRMALGAEAAGVVGLVLLSGARLVGVGLLLGYPAAWAASRSVQSMLFGVAPADPTITVVAGGLLVFAALVAAYLPARRASHVDPVTALRYD